MARASARATSEMVTINTIRHERPFVPYKCDPSSVDRAGTHRLRRSQEPKKHPEFLGLRGWKPGTLIWAISSIAGSPEEKSGKS